MLRVVRLAPVVMAAVMIVDIGHRSSVSDRDWYKYLYGTGTGTHLYR